MNTAQEKVHEFFEKMAKIYDEFGLDPHSIPRKIQPAINDLIKTLIKARVN